MILKTKVKNKVKAVRNLRWAGVKGISIAPEETLELDGGYPTACRNEQCVKQFKADIDKGLIEVTILTDMKTKKIKEPALDVFVPEKKAVPPKKKEVKKEDKKEPEEKKVESISEHMFVTTTPEETKKDVEKKEEIFDEGEVKGPMEDFFKKAFPEKEKDSTSSDTKAEAKAPETVNIFEDSKESSKASNYTAADDETTFTDAGEKDRKTGDNKKVFDSSDKEAKDTKDTKKTKTSSTKRTYSKRKSSSKPRKTTSRRSTAKTKETSSKGEDE